MTYIIHARCQFKWSSGFLGKEIRYGKLLCPVATILILDVGSEQNKMNCELMLTYDTPALRQTGSRNLMGPRYGVPI